MKTITIKKINKQVPSVIVGAMRFGEKTVSEMNSFIHTSLELGSNFFDHADIYSNGKSEEIFGNALSSDKSIKRKDLIIQSKCGINLNTQFNHYCLKKDYIINAVEGSLKRLQTDYLDILLLHRSDALVEPEEVAEAFNILQKSGKVLHFGVSNHKPMQIELLKKYINQPLIINQLQFSLPVSNMIANGLEVNMTTEGSINRDESVLDYSRLNDITIQAWSPFQMANWQGTFIDNPNFFDLNNLLQEFAYKYNSTKTGIAASWITTHPAKMQLIAGTTKEERLKEIIQGTNITLTHEEWYRLYLASGHILP